MQYDIHNESFSLGIELVNQSARNIFLTGKAGTGKTTFLKYIKDHCPKQMVIVAPTGVAAINAGGVTIHSFFQLPLSPFIPESTGFGNNPDTVVDIHSLISRQRVNKDKIRLFEELELLIIDEISMVRCDTIDAIDAVLRYHRKSPGQRFGGVQVLFIGDLFQLPPVRNDEVWNLLSPFYPSPYFFDSRVIQEELPLYIEFTKIYRQSEERFIGLLNQVRNNQLDQHGLALLESRLQPDFHRYPNDGYILLTTHNDKARETNAAELKKLEGDGFSYKAAISDDFPERVFPADEILELKVGAQVMFIKNDTDKSKRYFNGKIGTVTKLETDKIFVSCKGDDDEIEVKKDRWDHIRYTLDKATRKMEEDILGSFSQYPLRLAWAITIHKSQGLTFEKAIVDAGKAFASGQVYVALSRCTSLDGLVLHSRVTSQSLSTNPQVISFIQHCQDSQQLSDELIIARKHYQEQTLLSLFDFKGIVQEARELSAYYQQHASSFSPPSAGWMEQLMKQCTDLQSAAEKFHPWINSQFRLEEIPSANKTLQQKVHDGAAFFSIRLIHVIEHIRKSTVETDSRTHSIYFNDTTREIFSQVTLKQFLLERMDPVFDVISLFNRKRKFQLPALSINAYAGVATTRKESAHPELYQQLRKLRDEICSKGSLPIYMVAGSASLDEMTTYLPQTAEQLQQISGFGKVKVERYGERFLELIRSYADEHQLLSIEQEASVKPARTKKEKMPRKEKIDETKITRKSGPDTKSVSFGLYTEGKSIEEIAKERNLAPSTIEGHLAHYIEKGLLAIDDFLNNEKLSLIEPLFEEAKEHPMVYAKEILGEQVTFRDLKWAMAHRKFKLQST